MELKKVKEFLNEQDVYTLHKPARKNFKSQRVYVSGKDDQWQSDLVEMIPYAEENNGFSKFAWVVPLKSKSGKETADALESIFKERKPKKMQTDNGKEYYNSNKKASIVERFNRTLKEKMWKMFTHQGNHKWTHILDDLLWGYNNHYHTSIKMTPIEASKIENENIVYDNLFPIKHNFEEIQKNSKFKIGDTVRITKYKAIFDKGYLPNWSTEEFKISEVRPCSEGLTMYFIKDLSDEEIKDLKS
uniref:Integrase catalytic domain-containing protein n=1 Tax=Heterorhabditis bacteriophora TaxID=37862 RepID=A0A1I7X5F7_HETBA